MNIRIASYNIRHGLGDDNRLDLSRIRDVLREIAADFLFLQEVDRLFPRSGRLAQAEWLGSELGMAFAYEDNFRIDGLYGMGNAILSRTPFYSTWNKMLPYTGERRGMLGATTQIGDAPITLIATHWGLSARERGRQSAMVASVINQTKGLLLLGGDLNARAETSEVTSLILSSQLTDLAAEVGHTYPTRAPEARIDYLLGRGFGAIDATVVPTIASDHLPVLCNATVNETAPPDFRD